MTVDPIWCEVRLSEVAAIIDDYEVWKDDPWYHAIDWITVNDVMALVLQHNAVNGVCTELLEKMDSAAAKLSDVDAEGLFALAIEPVTITPVQLTNGGHRLKAMKFQGVQTVPGMFHPEDVGGSVRADQVYPLR